MKDDPPAIKKNKKNRQLMLDEWDRRSHRQTPSCSPISIKKNDENVEIECFDNENETEDELFLQEQLPESRTF